MVLRFQVVPSRMCLHHEHVVYPIPAFMYLCLLVCPFFISSSLQSDFQDWAVPDVVLRYGRGLPDVNCPPRALLHINLHWSCETRSFRTCLSIPVVCSMVTPYSHHPHPCYRRLCNFSGFYHRIVFGKLFYSSIFIFKIFILLYKIFII